MRETKVISFGHDYGAAPKTADKVFDVRDLTYPPQKAQVWQRAHHIADTISEGDTVAIGCAQGQHRGPAVARAVKVLFGGVELEHRDKGKAS